MLPSSVAAADDTLVRMEGGAADNGEEYVWTVTNLHRSPIVGLTIPCYRAALFQAPEGWTGQKLRETDAAVAEPGTKVYRFTATSPAAGITRNRSGEFTIRIKPGASAQRTPGKVHVRFADGSSTVLLGIEIPQPESSTVTQVRIIGLAALFALFIGVQVIRHRRRKKAADPAPQKPPPAPQA
ncbi:MAG: hypothetical protein IID40_02655 [Planctomycetes bacterium]|nr:hypothetical protein [Planctomycetota bacterium]